MIKKSEQELADELDVLLTEMLTKRPLPESSDHPEAQLAANLLKAAQQTEPSPQFVSRLEARLARAAKTATQQKKVLPEPSGWQNIILNLKELFTMKRIGFAFGGIAALVLVVLFAWTMFSGQGTTEPEIVANVTESAVTPTSGVTEEQELAQLPALPATQPQGVGGGGLGSGGGVEDSAFMGGPAIDGPYIFVDVFSHTTFVLNTTLPTEPRATNVLQQSEFDLTLEQARELANKFGFTGPLYTQPQRVDPNSDPSIPVPVFYIAYNGSQTLNLYNTGVSFYDSALTIDFNRLPSFEQASVAAETYLQQRGLLNFPYAIQKGYADSEVSFVRLIDDRPTNSAEIYVSVNGDGQIVYVQYNIYNALDTLGRYPLSSAEEAWALLQSGILANNLPYNVWANPANFPTPMPEPAPGVYQYWTRTYQPGEEVHLYTWPTVYIPAEDTSLPHRIEVYGSKLFLLTGNTADLVASTQQQDYAGYPVHIWGIVAADGNSVELVGWESFDGNYIYLDGNIQRMADGTVTIAATTGETYILPNAPADLPDGLKVVINGQASRDTGLVYPVLDWTTIDKVVDPSELPASDVVVEPMPVDIYQPYIYQQISFNAVELVYFQTYIYPESDQISYAPPPVVFQPAWRFTGTAENGDKIEVYVQAVTPEYIQSNS